MGTNAHRLESLKGIVGAEYVKSDPQTLSGYSVDTMTPWAVVLPGYVEQVAEVVSLAYKENLALVPWGSGSKIAMGNPPSRLDLVIGTRRLNRVIDMDTANLTATVQAGVRFTDIQSSLAGDPLTASGQENKGCFIPMLPPYMDSATVGGIIAANSTGPTRLLYGLPRDIVLGVRYVAPSGETVGMGGKTVKNVSGYDICKLMIGARGTLGILCEMTLRLLPLPERLGTCLFNFPSLREASRFADRIFETSLLPAAVEILNSRAYEVLAPQGAGKTKANGFVTAVSLEGFQEAVDRMASEIREMASQSDAEKSVYLHGDQHWVFWNGYSNLVPMLSYDYPDLVSFRLNYPISRYRELIELADSLIFENRLNYALLTHAGSGITLMHILLDQGDTKATKGVVVVAERLLDRCKEIGGNLVIERATPELKKRLSVWGLPGEDLILVKRIKEQIDPLGIFCPSRFAGGI